MDSYYLETFSKLVKQIQQEAKHEEAMRWELERANETSLLEASAQLLTRENESLTAQLEKLSQQLAQVTDQCKGLNNRLVKQHMREVVSNQGELFHLIRTKNTISLREFLLLDQVLQWDMFNEEKDQDNGGGASVEEFSLALNRGLRIAAESLNREFVGLILNHFAKFVDIFAVNAKNKNVLHILCAAVPSSDDNNDVDALVVRNAMEKKNVNNDEPIQEEASPHFIVIDNHWESILFFEELVLIHEHGKKKTSFLNHLNDVDNELKTPLQIAVGKKNWNLAEGLLNAGAQFENVGGLPEDLLIAAGAGDGDSLVVNEHGISNRLRCAMQMSLLRRVEFLSTSFNATMKFERKTEAEAQEGENHTQENINELSRLIVVLSNLVENQTKACSFPHPLNDYVFPLYCAAQAAFRAEKYCLSLRLCNQLLDFPRLDEDSHIAVLIGKAYCKEELFDFAGAIQDWEYLLCAFTNEEELKQCLDRAKRTMAKCTNYYHVLGITPTEALSLCLRSASEISYELKRKFKQKCLQHHPDKLPRNCSEEETIRSNVTFKLVNEAYRVLSQPELRSEYDAFLLQQQETFQTLEKSTSILNSSDVEEHKSTVGEEQGENAYDAFNQEEEEEDFSNNNNNKNNNKRARGTKMEEEAPLNYWNNY